MKLKDLFKKKNKENKHFAYPSDVRKLKKYDDRVEAIRNYFVK